MGEYIQLTTSESRDAASPAGSGPPPRSALSTAAYHPPQTGSPASTQASSSASAAPPSASGTAYQQQICPNNCGYSGYHWSGFGYTCTPRSTAQYPAPSQPTVRHAAAAGPTRTATRTHTSRLTPYSMRPGTSFAASTPLIYCWNCRTYDIRFHCNDFVYYCAPASSQQ